jgi:hypothetical protein
MAHGAPYMSRLHEVVDWAWDGATDADAATEDPSDASLGAHAANRQCPLGQAPAPVPRPTGRLQSKNKQAAMKRPSASKAIATDEAVFCKSAANQATSEPFSQCAGGDCTPVAPIREQRCIGGAREYIWAKDPIARSGAPPQGPGHKINKQSEKDLRHQRP